MNGLIDISIVVPVYNAEKSLEELYSGLKKAISERNLSHEIILVDDFSRDGSWTIIEKLKAADENVRGIQLSKNFGQHNATLCGIVKSKGEIIITIDDDLEASPADIGSLIEKQKETKAELVYAQFTNASPGFLRKFLTGIYKFFTRKIQGDKNGKGSSFRLITRQLADQLKNHFHEFVFIDELCLWYTRKVEFVDLKKHPSARKKSNYSIFELSLMTGDLVLFSTVFPLRMVTVIGGSLAIVNFIIGFYFIIKKFFLRVDVEGYTSLIVSILFSTGLILLAIGIVAEYLSKLLKSQYKKPGYSVYREI